MAFSAGRVLRRTMFGVACALAGAYLGANHVYDLIEQNLPGMLEEAGCVPPAAAHPGPPAGLQRLET